MNRDYYSNQNWNSDEMDSIQNAQFDPRRPPGGQQPGRPPGGQQPGRPPGGQQPGRSPGGQQPGRPPGGQQPGRPPGGQQPGRPPGGQQPGRPPGGQQPGRPPGGQQPGRPPGNQPNTAPPNYTPQLPAQFGVDGRSTGTRGFFWPPQDMRRCLNRFTFIWLINGNSFWFYPIDVRGQFIEGFRWRRNRWEFDRINRNRILFHSCN